MYEKLFKSLLYPLYEEKIAGRNTCRYVRQYQGQAELSRDQLEALQLQKLKALLRHAKEHCSYYRDTWNQIGFDPEQMVALTDIERLPILDKETITANYEGFVSSAHRGANITKATGGSSGAPFKFELDGESNERRQAVMWRGYGALGAGLGVKTLYVWGAHIAPVGKKTQIKDALYNYFYNRKILNSFTMNESNVGDFVARHNRYRATAVVGYVNPLVTMARHILDHNLTVHRPETILTGAEPLYEFQRELIEKAFDAPVYNTYGCREFMLIGSECKQRNGLHVNIDHLLVELTDEQGQVVESGCTGDVIVTDLHNYGFPLIRYRNGDQASWSDKVGCACGSTLPLISAVEGRKLDVIKTPDGRLLPGEFFPHLLKDFGAIKRFQVIQTELDTVQLKIVLNSGREEQELAAAYRLVESNLGPSVTLKPEIVEDIPLTASGKHRVTISAVS